MKTLKISVALLMFAVVLLSMTGCATNSFENTSTIPWDHPDATDTVGLPLTGSWQH